MKKYRILGFGPDDLYHDGRNPELLGATITPKERQAFPGGYTFEPLHQHPDGCYCGSAEILALPVQRTVWDNYSFSVGCTPYFAEVYLEELK